jgi:hypothetical protein
MAGDRTADWAARPGGWLRDATRAASFDNLARTRALINQAERDRSGVLMARELRYADDFPGAEPRAAGSPN